MLISIKSVSPSVENSVKKQYTIIMNEVVTQKRDTKYIRYNIYYLRKIILGLSQEKFGEKVGLSKDTISNIERGKYLPNISTLVSIANSLNVSVDFFLHKLEG